MSNPNKDYCPGSMDYEEDQRRARRKAEEEERRKQAHDDYMAAEDRRHKAFMKQLNEERERIEQEALQQKAAAALRLPEPPYQPPRAKAPDQSPPAEPEKPSEQLTFWQFVGVLVCLYVLLVVVSLLLRLFGFLFGN